MRDLNLKEIAEVSGGQDDQEEHRLETVVVTAPRPDSSGGASYFSASISSTYDFGNLTASEIFQIIGDPGAADAAWDAIGSEVGLSGDTMQTLMGDFPNTTSNDTDVDPLQAQIDALWASAIQDMGTAFVNTLTGLDGFLNWPDNSTEAP